MVSPPQISGLRLSSVVPAQVTGGDKDKQLTNMDLALKLHYLKALYFFQASEETQALTIRDLKKPMFPLLNFYFTTCGRIRRRSDDDHQDHDQDPTAAGRPFLKCNDGGIRIVEANCDKTMEEWLEMNHHQLLDDHHHLVYDQVLGPDLGFSPLVFIQFTKFKCGGISVGLSWAHVLGDLFSASNFINMWGQTMKPGHDHHLENPMIKSSHQTNDNSAPRKKSLSLKQVSHVGDSWVINNNSSSKMETYCFHVTSTQLGKISSQVFGENHHDFASISHFDILSAIIWKSLAEVREDRGPEIVTICASKLSQDMIISKYELPSNNNVIISVVRGDSSSGKGNVCELAKLIAEKKEEENGSIEEMVGSDDGKSDYIIYGANLTFVDLEGANIYGLEIMGQKPILANYAIKGVGDEGVVIILPGPDNGGRTVTVILPEKQVGELRNELRNNWAII